MDKGQVWIETVIYTTIGLVLIALVLTFVMPKLLQSKDKLLVQQSVQSLNQLDSTINDVIDSGPSNVRTYQILMKQGALYINSSSDSINFEIGGLSSPYSQPGVTIQDGRINLISTQGQSTSSVYMTLVYTGVNITYNGQVVLKEFDASPTPYEFSITNEGDVNNDGLDVISINEVSGG